MYERRGSVGQQHRPSGRPRSSRSCEHRPPRRPFSQEVPLVRSLGRRDWQTAQPQWAPEEDPHRSHAHRRGDGQGQRLRKTRHAPRARCRWSVTRPATGVRTRRMPVGPSRRQSSSGPTMARVLAQRAGQPSQLQGVSCLSSRCRVILMYSLVASTSRREGSARHLESRMLSRESRGSPIPGYGCRGETGT
jgi:hypothetical protein